MRPSIAKLRALVVDRDTRASARTNPPVLVVDYSDADAVARVYASGAVVVIPAIRREPADC